MKRYTQHIRIALFMIIAICVLNVFVIIKGDDKVIYNIDSEHLRSLEEKELSILFVGNSLTQDCVAYLPYYLKNYCPEIRFKIYIWYNAGYTLAQQYSDFQSNNPCQIFSVAENTQDWTNYNRALTMSEVLSNYSFDIVCLQEYFNYKASYENAYDWINCSKYITEHYHGGNALEFISLFHAPLRTSSESIFNITKEGNGRILHDTISQDMIPSGIAIYRALSTDLDSLGDDEHLSNDGKHAQEGLPCLIQTYVVVCWLFDVLNINKSIYGCDMRMTTEIYNSLNIPGPNLGSGVITGTDEQNLLAQEIAIKAYKEGKQFVIENLFSTN